jgi:hypothetical protein
MSEPSFLTAEQVEWLHQVAINRFGGSPGLAEPSENRDLGKRLSDLPEIVPKGDHS